MESIKIQDCVSSLPISRNYFVSSCPGALVIGYVEYVNGSYQYIKDQFIVIPASQILKFVCLLLDYGQMFVANEPNVIGPFQHVQFYGNDISINNKTFYIKLPSSKRLKLDLSSSSYFNMLRNIWKLVLFVIGPTHIEYEAVEILVKSNLNLGKQTFKAEPEEIENLARTLKLQNSFFLKHFFLLHHDILETYFELSKLMLK
jgi:hypothetical protein